MFVAIGWRRSPSGADGGELIATGENVRRRTLDLRDELTPQEEQIAALVPDPVEPGDRRARLPQPASTFKLQSKSKATTVLREHADRPPPDRGVAGWEEIADYALDWTTHHLAAAKQAGV